MRESKAQAAIQPRPQGAFGFGGGVPHLKSQGKAPWGRGWQL